MAQDVLTSVGDAAARKAREFAEASREKLEEIKKKSLEELLHETKEWMTANPGKTLVGALAAGYLLGRLLRRR
jgi:ElaB/YqjD/DUF883 family membrane-anchored ribosome-binding protein